MGSITSYFCGTHPQTEKILQTIDIAIANEEDSEQSILSHHKTILEELVKTAKPAAETIGHLSIQIALIQKIKASNCQKTSETDMKVVLRNQKDQGKSEKSESTVEDLIKPGYIIFSSAYYKGDISRGKAHGKGELHYPQAGYKVEGEWKHDSLRFGNVYKVAPQYTNQKDTFLFSLELRNAENDAVIKASGFQYRGSIKLEGSTKLNHLLTGNGEIRYSNGDIYRGRLVNGLYETVGSHSAIMIYSKGTLKSYQGMFKDGLKQDRGKLTFRQGNSQYTVSMSFSRGVPISKGEIRIDNQHYSFEARDNAFTDIEQSE